MGRVGVIGSSNLDFTVAVPALPRPGETVSGGQLTTSPGGKGANQAVAARRLGAEVRFVTLLGRDPMGDRVHAVLVGEGLPAGSIGRSDEAAPTGVALIIVDRDGRNQIAVAPGANHRLSVDHVARHAEVVAWADVLLIQLEAPLETVGWVLAEARRLGKRTILNPAPARVLPLPAGLLPLVDVLTPNEIEAALLTGNPVSDLAGAQAAAGALLREGVGAAVVTLGEAGALCCTREGCIRVPGFPVSPLDTVGAGDAFSGALAAELAAGAELVDAVLVANAAGALTCTRRGAIDALPTRAEVRALLDQERRWPGSVAR